MKLSYPIIIFTFVLALFGLQAQTALAATELPASSWYAVTYVSNTDTLHWVNAQGEQGQLDRPHLPNELENPAQLQIKISPNGQFMVLMVTLNTGNLGIGFYDFTSGQFVQMHEAQPNEVLPAYSNHGFSFSGTHFAIVLRNTVSKEWRVIAFETQTGNALDQLTYTNPKLPNSFITDLTYYPIISYVGLDEGMGQTFVGLQLVNDNPTITTFASFDWYFDPAPIMADAPIVASNLPYSPFAGYDVHPGSEAIAFTGFNEQIVQSNVLGSNISTQQNLVEPTQALVNGGSYIFNSPQWLKTRDWVGYRVQDGVHQPYYAITSAQSDTSLPLGPNIGSIDDTPDGLVAVDSVNWQLYHLTDTTNVEGFAAQFGNTIFSSNGQPFSVVYTTPAFVPFTLTSIPTDAQVNVPLGGNGDVQAPEQTCGTAPAPAPRLTVGNTARVAFTDGTDLNIRNAAAGDYIMQIPEGTVVNVISGPVCAENYFWWQIQFQSEGVTVGGWAAEGSTDAYFLEPYNISVANPPQTVPSATPELQIQAQPTSTPELQIVTQPTSTPELQIQAQPTSTPQLQIAAQPTNTKPARAITPSCSKAPESQLVVGMDATTTSLGGGTLAMRINLKDEYPSYQVPANHFVKIVSMSTCHDGFRMWQVTTEINGQWVTGWVADGINNTYYVIPQ